MILEGHPTDQDIPDDTSDDIPLADINKAHPPESASTGVRVRGCLLPRHEF